MKKIILYSAFLLSATFAFGQSVLIEPGASKRFVIKSNAGTYGHISTADAGGADLFFKRSATGDGSSGTNAGNISTYSDRFYIGGQASHELALGANSTEYMRIDNTGKVGIGTMTPATTLDVLGASQWVANFSSPISQSYIGFRRNTSTNTGYVGTFNDAANNSMEIGTGAFNTTGSVYLSTNIGPKLTVNPAGRVGIGTTSPLDKLHLNESSGSGDVYTRISSTTGFTGLRLQNLGGDWQLFSNEFDKMFLDYSPDNFVNRTGVLTFEPNGVNFNMIPTTNNTVFLGSSGNRWREIWSVNALNTASDRRLKKNIVEIKYGLDEIMRLQAVSYNWKNNNDPKLQLGFIAQDVEKIVPEIVSKSGLTDEEFAKLEKKGETVADTYGMQYTGLIPVLVKAIQEQQRIIEGKSQKINQLEARLSAIEASLGINKNANNKADK